MNCEAAKPFLDSYADGELDLVNHVKVEEHLEDCFNCDLYYKDLKSLKSALTEDQSLYFRAPADLKRSIRSTLRAGGSERPSRNFWFGSWTPVFAALGIAFITLLTVITVLRPEANNSEDLVAAEMVSSHVRSMMLDHLMDVPSSDQHTVKPWFEGKLDFSPPVIDLGQQGFTLVGGRLDYAGGRPIAAIVYKRRQHVINLFVYPESDSTSVTGKTLVKQGFNIVRWSRSGMAFWAVSDLNAVELQQFADMLKNN
jgi:anti-sigma factor RsiW